MADVNKEIALKVTTDTSQTQKAFANAQQELEETRKALVDLALAGKQSSEEFKRMEARAGQLQDAIGDINRRVTNLATDTPKLQLLTEAATGIAAGFSIAQGAAALFAGENEELQQAILKTQSAMALLNGVQSAANVLNKDSAIMMRTNAIATGAYNTILGTTTGALKLFRVALAATGIGLAVVAVGALVANFDAFKKAILGFIETSAPLKAVIDFISRGFNRVGEALGILPSASEKATKQMIADLEKQKKLLEASGADTAALDKRLAELRIQLAKQTGEGLAEAEEELTLVMAAQNKERADKAAEAEAKRVEAAKQAQEKIKAIREKERADFEQMITEIQQIQFDADVARMRSKQEEAEQLEAIAIAQMEAEAARRMSTAQAEMDAANIRLENEKTYARTRLEVISNMFGSLSQLSASFAAGQGKNAENAFKLSKKLAIAQTTIDTYLGAQSAFAQTPGGIVIKGLAAAAAVAAGLARINQIRQQQFNAPQVNVTSAPIQLPQLNGQQGVPQSFNPNTSSPILPPQGQGGAGQPQGQRVYVLERDIRNVGQRVSAVERFATFG